MKEREELKLLVAAMNEEQFEWFVSQVQRVVKPEKRSEQPGNYWAPTRERIENNG